MSEPSRRRFLAMAATACASAVGCGGGGGSPPVGFGDVSAGNVSSQAIGALSAIPGQPACIARDAGGLYAMTLTWTHQGCQASVVGQQIACPCHGSVFDNNGNVVSGPASEPLQHFGVSVDGSGNITVHGGTPVGAGTRVAV